MIEWRFHPGNLEVELYFWGDASCCRTIPVQLVIAHLPSKTVQIFRSGRELAFKQKEKRKWKKQIARLQRMLSHF